MKMLLYRPRFRHPERAAKPSNLAACRPVSLLSLQTARQLGNELGMAIDKRRFRANIFLDLRAAVGFCEDEYVGRTLRMGLEDSSFDPRARSAVRDDLPRSGNGGAQSCDPSQRD
jgi:hypothetical protein